MFRSTELPRRGSVSALCYEGVQFGDVRWFLGLLLQSERNNRELKVREGQKQVYNFTNFWFIFYATRWNQCLTSMEVDVIKLTDKASQKREGGGGSQTPTWLFTDVMTQKRLRSPVLQHTSQYVLGFVLRSPIYTTFNFLLHLSRVLYLYSSPDQKCGTDGKPQPLSLSSLNTPQNYHWG